MPRPVRIDFPGARHHVMNRGARRQPVFYDDDSCGEFLEYVGAAVERFGIRVHGFALMPNHYHLMVESARGNLSSAMQNISSRYGRWINEVAEFDGSLFRGRFHNRLVFEDRHWRHLLTYLHLNPVRANLVMKPEQANWTSHGVYTGEDRYPEWLTTADLKKRLRSVGGYKRYLRDVMSGKRNEPEGFNAVIFEGRQAGRLMMVKHKQVQTGRSARQALKQVLDLTGASEDELRRTRRGRAGNSVRALAAWWLVHGAGFTNVEASEMLGMTPGAVGKLLSKLRTSRSYSDGKLREWMFALSAKHDGKGQ